MRSILKKSASILLAFSILVFPVFQISTASAVNTFKDIKSSAWYYTYVSRLVDLKITSGYNGGTYKPDSSVTRAEFVTFLCKAVGYKPAQGISFADTEKHWASGYLAIALPNGIIDLPADKKFRPDTAITRLEAVEMLCRALNITKDTTGKNPYIDVKIDDSGYTNAAYANFLMLGSVEQGKRYFKPTGKLTRAEAASIIVNGYDYKTDKMAYLNKRVIAEKEQAAKEKSKADKYKEWLSSIDKGVSTELLNNVTGLIGGKTLQECSEYATTELLKFQYWMKDCGVTDALSFKDEFVSAGRDFSNLYYNRSYTKLDVLEEGLKKQLDSTNVENYLERTLNDTKNNKVVKQSQFFTGQGLVLLKGDTPVLRGTLKYRYLKPTDTKIFASDICIDTGKPCEYNTWYKVDIEITFNPENGLKISRASEISRVRLWR